MAANFFKKNILILTPVFGVMLFVALYLLAASLYPGGSQTDTHAPGFSWINNYWCNLLNETAINGQPNTAKPVAITGMFVLCLTLMSFWLLFPNYVDVGKNIKRLIWISGVLAMVASIFLSSSINHDLITNLASLLGLIAMAGVFVGLYKSKWMGLFGFGVFNILLVVINNYVYYSRGLIIYLPVIQKITFASFLIWICCLDVKLYLLARKDG